MKICNECGEEKPLNEFYAHRRMKDGHFNRCKSCDRARSRESMRRVREESDPAELASRRATWSRNARMRQYGITQDDYDRMLAGQNGGCAICGSTEAGAWGGRLPVDHDHQTGEVRGLLCHACNGGLGRFGDDVDRLMAAAAYLLANRDILKEVF